MIDDGVLVGFVDLRDEIPAVATDLVVGRVVHHVGREDDVIGVEGRAVGPFDAVAQMPGDRQTVFAHAAVGRGRNDGRQLGDRAVVVAVPHQIRFGEQAEVAQDQRRRQVRVEVVEVLSVADAQRVRDRVRVLVRYGLAAARGARSLPARLGAAGQQQRRRRDRECSVHRRLLICRRRRGRRTG